MSRRIAAGFSLFEMTLVLAIIGLVTGAIFVGRILLRGAEMRKVHRQYEEFVTAYQTFRSKYGCVPGDCKNATEFFGTSDNSCPVDPGITEMTGTCNGDGSGFFDDLETDRVENEGLLAWQQLAYAGLIGGTYIPVDAGGGAGYLINLDHGGWSYITNYNCPPILSNAHCWLWADVKTQAPSMPIVDGGYRTVLAMWPMAGTRTVSSLPSERTYASRWSPFVSEAFAGSSTPPPPPPPPPPPSPPPPPPVASIPGTMFFTPAEAYEYDGKFDDGRPASGLVQAQSAMYIVNCTTGSDATATYNVGEMKANCGFFYLPRL